MHYKVYQEVAVYCANELEALELGSTRDELFLTVKVTIENSSSVVPVAGNVNEHGVKESPRSFGLDTWDSCRFDFETNGCSSLAERANYFYEYLARATRMSR
jgi:hypothetical protein